MAGTGDSTRYHGDTWDLASSVGATATMIAAARALATKDPRRLIDDPFAAPLVRAVGIEFFTKAVDGELEVSPFGDLPPERVDAMIAGMALRTRFFDECFLAATATGVRQAVILASGLDARAYRLDWPAETVVFEIDQPEVIEFKTRTLADLGAEPSAMRRTVGIDLRADWSAALRDAGFDASAPTAWIAEGLLIYLPAEAQDTLFDDITAQSAPGSTIGTEYVPGITDFDAERARTMSANMRTQGFDLDMPSLVYTGKRSNVLEYLTGKGWQVTGSPGDQLFTRAGLAPPDHGDYDPLGEIIYVSATLP